MLGFVLFTAQALAFVTFHVSELVAPVEMFALGVLNVMFGGVGSITAVSPPVYSESPELVLFK